MKRSFLGIRETSVGLGLKRDRRCSIGDRKERIWMEIGHSGGFSLEEKASSDREIGLSALLVSSETQGTALPVTEFLSFHVLLFKPTANFRTLGDIIGLKGLGESTIIGAPLGNLTLLCPDDSGLPSSSRAMIRAMFSSMLLNAILQEDCLKVL